MAFIDFFKSKFSNKLTREQKREKCNICKSKSSKHSPVRKHKCCSAFICYDCFVAWYQRRIYQHTINCHVCTKKYTLQVNEIDHTTDSDDDIHPYAGRNDPGNWDDSSAATSRDQGEWIGGFTRTDLANWVGGDRISSRPNYDGFEDTTNHINWTIEFANRIVSNSVNSIYNEEEYAAISAILHALIAGPSGETQGE